MNQDKECSRCGHIISAGIDQQKQMKRHVEGRHTEHTTKGERPYQGILHQHGMGNLDIGKVNWINLWT